MTKSHSGVFSMQLPRLYKAEVRITAAGPFPICTGFPFIAWS